MKKHISILIVALLALSTACPLLADGTNENFKLRVGTYNIQGASWVRQNYTTLVKDCKDAGLDLVGFQEVDRFTNRSHFLDMMKEMSICSNGRYPYYKFSKAINYDDGEYGTGILSSFPIESFEVIPLPGPGESRSLGHAVLNINGTLVDYYNTHLEWANASGRMAQLKYIKETFEKSEIWIFTADLNTPKPEEYAPSFPFANYANGLETVYITNEDGAIDNVISTRNRFIQTGTGMVNTDGTHSDHNMLWADLELLPEPALREDEDGIKFYVDGEPVKGPQTIGYEKMYFDPETGVMESEDFDDYRFEEFTACGKTLYRLTEEKVVAYPYITDPNGLDVTEQLTNGDLTDYLDGHAHWYGWPEGPLWTIQDGVLVIGGVYTLKPQGFSRFKDEIKTIIVAPQNPEIKYGGDFGVRTGVILEKINSGVFKGLDNITAYIPENVELSPAAFDEDAHVTLMRTVGKDLTVAPATGTGIVNDGGKTLLKLTIKDGDKDLALKEGQKIVTIYDDGEKNNEGEFFCSALKYSALQPTYEDGVFTFDICAPIGPDQFIPQYSATYIVNIFVLNADGSVAAQGSTQQFVVKCNDEPIAEERTSDFVYLSVDNHLDIDLGDSKSVTGFGAAYVQDSRYYQWQLYGTNDKKLPLCKWDFLGEKGDKTPSNSGMYSIEVNGNKYRYLRICTSYASSRWTALYSEIKVDAHSDEYDDEDWRSDENEHWHVYIDSDVEVPGTRSAHIEGNWEKDYEGGIQTKSCTVCKRVLAQEALAYPVVFDAAGTDVTAKMTDGSVSTYLDGNAHWYFMPETPVWTIEQGVLEIGGIGQLEAGQNFGRFNDEITTIIVAPQDPSIKYGGDFGVRTNVVLESIGSGAFAGLANVKKAYIPANVTLADDAFDEGVDVQLFRTAAKTLTVAPATGYGLVNEGGKTLLKLTIKDGSNDLTLEAGQKIAVLYTDGEKRNEGGTFFCSTIKYSETQPTYDSGVFIFDVCAPNGENQFVPQYELTYIANVYVLNEDGTIAAQGSSQQFAIRCTEEPIFTERTARFTENSPENFLVIDLGAKKELQQFSLAYGNFDRYYQWQLYGSNDKDLPVCKWDFLGEKNDKTSSTEGAYSINVTGQYRYLRVHTSYASSRWTALYAEVSVTANDIGSDKTEKK